MTNVFTDVLGRFLAGLPAAKGAVFADDEGETIACVAVSDLEQARIGGAHWGIVHYLTQDRFCRLALGAPTDIIIRCAQEQIVVRRISVASYLAVFFAPSARMALGQLRPHVDDVQRALEREM